MLLPFEGSFKCSLLSRGNEGERSLAAQCQDSVRNGDEKRIWLTHSPKRTTIQLLKIRGTLKPQVFVKRVKSYDASVVGSLAHLPAARHQIFMQVQNWIKAT